MAKGNRGGKREGTGRGVNPANVSNAQNLISQRETKQAEVDYTLSVLRDMQNEYGVNVDTFTADIGGKDSGVLAFCDGNGDITINASYFNTKAMDGAMKDSVDSEWHPSLGNKSGIESVVSHEFGHTLTHKAGEKMGGLTIDQASDRIVKEARKITGDKGVVIMARKISRYATSSNAEAIAEAVCDCYCNGNKAKAQSKAIKKVLDSYLH